MTFITAQRSCILKWNREELLFLIQAEYEKDQNLLEATKEVESGADSVFYYGSGREEYRLCNTSEWG